MTLTAYEPPPMQGDTPADNGNVDTAADLVAIAEEEYVEEEHVEETCLQWGRRWLTPSTWWHALKALPRRGWNAMGEDADFKCVS
jgi:hypothetical protein